MCTAERWPPWTRLDCSSGRPVLPQPLALPQTLMLPLPLVLQPPFVLPPPLIDRRPPHTNNR